MKNKKTAILLGGLGALGIIGYLYHKNNKKFKNASAGKEKRKSFSLNNKAFGGKIDINLLMKENKGVWHLYSIDLISPTYRKSLFLDREYFPPFVLSNSFGLPMKGDWLGVSKKGQVKKNIGDGYDIVFNYDLKNKDIITSAQIVKK
jgi:hypothetical protein